MNLLRPAPKPTPRPPKAKKRVARKAIRKGPPKVRDRAYLDWIKTQGCEVVHRAMAGLGNGCGYHYPERPCDEPAHVKTKGSGGADRGNTCCLCPDHHDEQEGDTEGFEKVYGVNLKLEAAQHLVRYIVAGEP